MKLHSLKFQRLHLESGTTRRVGRQYMKEAVALRAWKRGTHQLIVENIWMPIATGKVPVYCCITPAGGWERIFRKHPAFATYHPAVQLKVVLSE